MPPELTELYTQLEMTTFAAWFKSKVLAESKSEVSDMAISIMHKPSPFAHQQGGREELQAFE